jgi:hypothetical protein
MRVTLPAAEGPDMPPSGRAGSGKPPASYMPLIQKSGAEAFENQAIPTDGTLLELSSYREVPARAPHPHRRGAQQHS